MFFKGQHIQLQDSLEFQSSWNNSRGREPEPVGSGHVLKTLHKGAQGVRPVHDSPAKKQASDRESNMCPTQGRDTPHLTGDAKCG